MQRHIIRIAAVVLCWIVGSLTPLQAQVFDAISGNPLQTADKEYEMALANWADGKSEANEALLKNALSIRTAMLGPEHPSVADVLERLGAIEYNRGRYGDAEAKFRQALAIYTNSYGEENLLTLRTLGDVGAALREEGRYSEAAEVVEHSVSLRRKMLPPDSPIIAGGLNNLGRIYLAQGSYSKAQEVLAESARIFRASGHEDLAADDDALIRQAADAAARLYRLMLVVAGAFVVCAFFGGADVACTVAIEKAYAANPPRRPADHLSLLILITQMGFLLACVALGMAGAAALLSVFGSNPEMTRVAFGGGVAVALALLPPCLRVVTNRARQSVGLPAQPMMFLGRQFGQPSEFDQSMPTRDARVWFPAFEYHAFAANYVFKVFVTPQALCGARLSRLTAGLVLSQQLGDAAFWMQSAQARAYDRIDPDSERFLRFDEPNFKILWNEISSLEYIPKRNWACRAIPHKGRLVVRLRYGESREFLLVGNQDGEDLKLKLEQFRAAGTKDPTESVPVAATGSSGGV